MGKLVDLTGQRFGRLVVLKREGVAKHGASAKWMCQCDCGNLKVISADKLKSGNTKSCGCLQKELTVERGKRNRLLNKYRIEKDCVVMLASNTLSEFYIDLDDLERVKEYTWFENKRGYIVKTNGRLRLHQFIKGENPEGYVIDHLDRNKLNNRKSNLVFKTQTDNTKNRSINKNNKFGVSGVHKSRYQNLPYEASLGAGGCLFRQSYATLKEAIIARLRAEKRYYGNCAPQSYLFKEYGIE